MVCEGGMFCFIVCFVIVESVVLFFFWGWNEGFIILVLLVYFVFKG